MFAELEADGAISLQCLKNAERFVDDIRSDAVTFQYGDAVSGAHCSRALDKTRGKAKKGTAVTDRRQRRFAQLSRAVDLIHTTEQTDMVPAVADERQIKILLVDDDEMIRKSAGAFLRKMGHEVIFATNGREGLEWFEREGADIVISDIMMPDVDGLDFLRSLKERGSDVEVILVTGHGDLDTAVEALRQGAFDFFTKPVRLEELKAALERTRRYQSIRREKDRIQARLESLVRSSDVDQSDIIGESDAMAHVGRLVAKVASTERTTVLIRGESGAGKELVARAIHRASPRADAAFITHQLHGGARQSVRE